MSKSLRSYASSSRIRIDEERQSNANHPVAQVSKGNHSRCLFLICMGT